MPRGGKREGAGRRKGTNSHLTSQLIEEARALASPYAAKAIKELAKIGGIIKGKRVVPVDNPAARVQALSIILDRAYGKPKQPVEGEMLHGMSEELRQFIAGNSTRARSFLGFDEEDQHSQEEANGRALHDH